MDSNIVIQMETSAKGDGDGVEAVDHIMEDAWFFGNLLHRTRKHMTRCLSDPCPSSSDYHSVDILKKEPEKEESSSGRDVPDKSCTLVGKDLDINKSSSEKLVQDCCSSTSPSSHVADDQYGQLEPTEKTSLEVWNEAVRLKASDGNDSGSSGSSPYPVLRRAPSLPPCIGREEMRMEESSPGNTHPRMTKANRQASLNLTDFLPPRHGSKGISNYRYRISSDEDMRRRILGRTKSIKSRGELEYEELQGFKDLGFTFDKKDLSPKIVNILPGLQENKDSSTGEDKTEAGKQRKPYLSEAWLSQSFAPPIPKWSPNGPAKEDVKAHIKFWARAVASNVQTEC